MNMKKTLWAVGIILVLVIIGVYFFNISFRTGNGKAELSFGKNPVSLTDKNTVLIPTDSGVDSKVFSNQSAKYQINLPLNWTEVSSTSSGDLITRDTFEPSDVSQNPGRSIRVINFTYQAYTNKDGSKLTNQEIVGHELNSMKQGSFTTAQDVHVYESKTDSNIYVSNFSFTDGGKTFKAIVQFIFTPSSFYDLLTIVPSDISQQDFNSIQTSLSTFRVK